MRTYCEISLISQSYFKFIFIVDYVHLFLIESAIVAIIIMKQIRLNEKLLKFHEEYNISHLVKFYQSFAIIKIQKISLS
jgi:hypothetical protein